MPGLPRSWTDFDLYLSCNVTATQRLLEVVKGSRTLKRFVYGSTSDNRTNDSHIQFAARR